MSFESIFVLFCHCSNLVLHLPLSGHLTQTTRCLLCHQFLVTTVIFLSKDLLTTFSVLKTLHCWHMEHKFFLQDSQGPFPLLSNLVSCSLSSYPSFQPYWTVAVSGICLCYFSHAVLLPAILWPLHPFSAWGTFLKGITHGVTFPEALKETSVSSSLCLLCIHPGCSGSHIRVFCLYFPLTQNLFPGGFWAPWCLG